MHSLRTYPFESLLVGTAALLTFAGFWNVYFGPQSEAGPYHHLHIATVLAWLVLLASQLALAGSRNYSTHRRLGLLAIVAAPLLVASTTLLSVESARKGVASGRGDFMVVQNVMGTLELALIIVLAFALRRRRQLHASFLASTALMFAGIAAFFSLIGFVPGFRIEGPETFDRFGKALVTIQYASLVVGLLFFARDRRNGWPFLLVGAFPLLNGLIKSLLEQGGLIEPLTGLVGAANQPSAFAASFSTVLLVLAATGLLKSRVRQLA